LPLDLDEIGRRAATLDERVAAIRDADAGGPAGSPSERQTLARWQQVFSPSDAAAFARRLAWDGLDEDTAARAVADEAPPAAAEWTAWLPIFLDAAAEGAAEMAAVPSEDEPPFVELWVPFLRVARRALARAAGPLADGLAPAAALGLETRLRREIAMVAELALYERFTSSGLSYDDFVRTMLAGGLGELFTDLPVLARQMTRLVETWVDSSTEMLQRLEADQAAIASMFGDADPGPLASVSAGLSDRHHDGRRVAVLTFASGRRLVYKPRDVSLERGFHECLAWLRARGLGEAPRPLVMLARDGYGWAEYVEAAPLETPAAVGAYYRRAGVLLAVAHVLRARDLHNENVVAAPDGPILIDVEALLQPVDRQEADGAEEGGRAARRAAGSCLATSLVSLVSMDAAGAAHDAGGLRAAEPHAATLARRRWHGQRTDALGFEPDPSVQLAASNAVSCGDRSEPPDAFASEVAEGFAEGYRFLMSQREALLDPAGPLEPMARCHTRVLYRPSDQYGALLYVLAAPRYQRDGRARSLGIESLARVFAREASRPILWPLVTDERASLEALDVPRFTIPVDETTAASSRGERSSGYFVRSGLEAVRARVRGLSEADLTAQLDLLQAALAPASAAIVVPGDASSRDALVAAAERLATELERLPPPTPSGADDRGEALALYDGHAGRALFLAALAAVTQKDEWGARARAEMARVADAAEEGAGPNAWRAIGGGTGVGSTVYALAVAARLLGDPSLRARAEALASRLTVERIAAETQTDVECGLAGTLLGLLSLPAAEATSLRARACGERLLALQVPTSGGAAWPTADGRALAGFAHGAAGVAYALARLHALTGEPALAEAVHRAWQHERALYSASERNWPLVRGGGGTLNIIAWCHGAPGLALARAMTPKALRDEPFADEIRTAVDTTARAPMGRFDHLCCGNLGRADILLTLGRRLRAPGLVVAAEATALRVAEQVQARGRLGVRTAGFQWRVALPGLFDGLSGIGYALLRAAAPAALPSVLAFENMEGV